MTTTKPRGTWVRSHVRGLRQTSLASACILFVVLVFTLAPTPVYSIDASPGRVIVLIGIIGVLTVARVALTERAMVIFSKLLPGLALSEHGEAHYSSIDRGALADHYLAQFLDSPYYDSLVDIVAVLVRPPDFVSRISQGLTLKDETYEVSLARTVTGPGSMKLFPVLRVAKGMPLGQLRVFADEKRAHTVAFDVSKGAMIAAMFTLYDRVVATAAGDALLQRCAELAVERGTSNYDAERAKLIVDLEKVVEASGPPHPERAALMLVVSMAIYCDVIFMALPAGLGTPQRLRAEYGARYSGGLPGPRNVFRALFGIGRKDFSFVLPYVADSRSFHLDVTGPDGMFVSERYLWAPGSSSELTIGSPASGRPRDQVMQITPRQGDGSAHFYMRDFDGAPLIDRPGPYASPSRTIPEFRIEFRENPPGLMGPVLAVSLWLVAVTWIVGYFHDLVFPAQATGTSGTPPQSWPTLIFGVPAIVTGWLLSRATAQAVRSASMSTFLALIGLALNAALLITISALKSSGVETLDFVWGPVHLGYTLWAAMMFSTAVHAVVSSAIFLSHGLYYSSIERRG